MDLALEMGMPYEQLARQMTEREFRAWGEYASRKMLPARRMEWYLAQITRWIAMTMGGAKDAKTSDFMMEFEPVDPYDALEEARQALGFPPRKP